MFERLKGEDDRSGARSGAPDWSILEKYAEDERKRVEGIKSELNEGRYEVGGLSLLEQDKKVQEPKLWRKIGRVALDAVNLHPRRSERKRQQEALAVATREIEEERAERRFEVEMGRLSSQTGSEVRRIMRDEEQERREKERFERDMAEGMDAHRYHERERYELERKQEFLERDLNEKLVTVDELEGQVEAGNLDVEKHFTEYEGKEIPIYDLKGLPFAMLSHSIEYRKVNYNDDYHMGVQTSKQLVENPEIWKQRNDEFELVQVGGTARGNVISAPYINSEHNLNTRCHETNRKPDICYGFERVEGDAILASWVGDMGSTNSFGGMRGATRNLLDWSVLEAMPTGWDGYNEVVLRRYDETGKPRLPDYIIAQNGEITDGMLKHAAAFNIPVVNIEEKYYNEKFRKKAEEILANVGGDDDYQKVVAAFHEIGSFGPYRSTMAHINQTTLNKNLGVVRENLDRDYPRGFEQKLVKLGDLELEKRIPFIVGVLQDELGRIREATERGEFYKKSADGFEFFDVTKIDGKGYTNPAEAEYLLFNMRLKGDKVNIKTEVYRNDGANGEIYALLAPLVEEYNAARQDNFSTSASAHVAAA